MHPRFQKLYIGNNYMLDTTLDGRLEVKLVHLK